GEDRYCPWGVGTQAWPGLAGDGRLCHPPCTVRPRRSGKQPALGAVSLQRGIALHGRVERRLGLQFPRRSASCQGPCFRRLMGGGDVPPASRNYWPDTKCAKAFWSQHTLPPYQQLLSDTSAWLDPRPGERWLDLGCGSGQLTRALWRQSGGAV